MGSGGIQESVFRCAARNLIAGTVVCGCEWNLGCDKSETREPLT